MSKDINKLLASWLPQHQGSDTSSTKKPEKKRWVTSYKSGEVTYVSKGLSLKSQNLAKALNKMAKDLQSAGKQPCTIEAQHKLQALKEIVTEKVTSYRTLPSSRVAKFFYKVFRNTKDVDTAYEALKKEIDALSISGLRNEMKNIKSMEHAERLLTRMLALTPDNQVPQIVYEFIDILSTKADHIAKALLGQLKKKTDDPRLPAVRVAISSKCNGPEIAFTVGKSMELGEVHSSTTIEIGKMHPTFYYEMAKIAKQMENDMAIKQYTKLITRSAHAPKTSFTTPIPPYHPAAELEKCLQLNNTMQLTLLAESGYPPAQYAMGRYYQQTGDTKKAIEHYKQAETNGYSPASFRLYDIDPASKYSIADLLNKNDIASAIYDIDTAKIEEAIKKWLPSKNTTSTPPNLVQRESYLDFLLEEDLISYAKAAPFSEVAANALLAIINTMTNWDWTVIANNLPQPYTTDTLALLTTLATDRQNAKAQELLAQHNAQSK